MSRDVVLDIIFTKMIGREYMAGVDCEWLAFEEDVQVARALITKGLVREYAGAVKRNDVTAMTQVSKALDGVPIMKATELWQMITGQVQRDVRRDEKGRFARNISTESYNRLPEKRSSGKEKRAKGVPTATAPLVNAIDAQMQGREPGGNKIDDEVKRGKATERGRRQAGQVRAIQRLQDELMEVFGENNDDIVVIVETVPEAGQEPVLQGKLRLDEPVSMQTLDEPEGVLPSSGDDPLQITYGLREGAKPETRETFDSLGGLVDIGMRPETALQYAAGKGPETPGGKLGAQALAYTGQKKSSNQEKAQRHYKTADTLGTYFTESGIPQLAGAGRALKATARIGDAIPTDAYEVAERANYRYRGMKDNLPKAMTVAMNAGEHKLLASAFDDPELTPEKWADNLKRVGDHLQEMEVRNKDAFNADPFRPVLAAAIAATPAGVSPRDFLDRYNRDLAIMSLIPELPADSRAVKLGEMAGYGVPSSGVVIRPDGKFKEMYRGVGPDHYLPFSGKALPELRDGQYVRTRYRGGLTNEDISVLVASGARKATVVSSSGMFTIELKPDTSLEGRMRSPEVAAMAERYERILDQITNAANPLYMKDLDPQTKEKLRNQAVKFTGQSSGEAYQKRYEALETKERAEQSQLSNDEIDKITQDVVDQAKAGTLSDEDAGRTTEMLIKEAIADARKEKVRAISLNAEGYGMALETLKLQYPSIIRRVSYEPLKDFVNDRGLKGAIDPASLALRNRPGGSDSGYVRPGETVRHPKGWTRNDDTSPKAVAMSMVEAARTASAAGGAGGVGAGAEKKKEEGEPKKAGSATEVFSDVLVARKDQMDALARSAKMPMVEGMDPVLQVPADEAANKPVEFFGMMVGDDSSDTTQKGPDVDLGKHAGLLGFMSTKDVAKAAMSEQGLTVAMGVAFNPDVMNTSDLWDQDADKVAGAELARTGVEQVVSAAMLKAPLVKDAPLKNADEYGFYIPEEVRAGVPEGKGMDVAQVLATVESRAYDEGTAEGQARMRAKAFLDQALSDPGAGLYKDDPDSDKRFGQDMTGLEDLSLLGLLAFQTRTLAAIETSQKEGSEQSRHLVLGLNGGDEAAFDSTSDFDVVKRDLSKAVQEVFGTEYLRRLLGGGGVGPKGQLVMKSDRPLLAMLEESLRSLSVSKAGRLQPQPVPRPRIHPSRMLSPRRSPAG